MSFKEGDTRHDFQVQCPYNRSHQMPHSRLFYHITQGCQDKARVEHLFDHCPYNFLHIIAIADMDSHIRQCKDAQSTEGNLMNEMQNLMKTQQQPKKKQQAQVQQQNQIPGFSGEQPQKKKRVRNKKNKQLPEEQAKTGIPNWGDDSDNDQEKQEQKFKELNNQFEEQLKVKDIKDKVAQNQITKQEKDNDDDWQEVVVQPRGGRGQQRRVKEKEEN